MILGDKKLITILAGGSGSVKLVRGLASHRSDVNVVTNVGDNYWLYGMYICPDIDTITYGLADLLQTDELNFIQYYLVSLSFWLTEFTSADMIYIGYLIPGLMASWMDKQGVITTSSIILIISSFINLILMLLAKYV